MPFKSFESRDRGEIKRNSSSFVFGTKMQIKNQPSYKIHASPNLAVHFSNRKCVKFLIVEK